VPVEGRLFCWQELPPVLDLVPRCNVLKPNSCVRTPVGSLSIFDGYLLVDVKDDIYEVALGT